MKIFNIFNKKDSPNFDLNIDTIKKSEYIIFLSKYNINYRFFNKYEILNYDINIKNDVMNFINKYNIDNKKKIFFYENNIDSDVLYKKIKFSSQEIFVPINIYSIKKMDFRIKTLCQIAELLGAESIDITFKKFDKKYSKIGINLDGFSNGINGESISTNEEKDDFNIKLAYSKNNQKYSMNLNKYNLYLTVNEEKNLFIKKEDFYSDIDLQFLIESRCNNFINDYITSLSINRFNNFESNILLKANNFGIKFDLSSLKNETIVTDIKIKFLNIYDNYKYISGNNLTPSRNSFNLLYGFIKEEIENIKNKKISENSDIILLYSKIINYYRVYFKYANYDFFSISKTNDISFDYNIYQKFIKIVIQHFNKNEANLLFYKLFHNLNDGYFKFKEVRNKILFGIKSHNDINIDNKEEDNLINKLDFLCYYYNDIEKVNNFMIDNITTYYSKFMYDFIKVYFELDYYKNFFTNDKMFFIYNESLSFLINNNLFYYSNINNIDDLNNIDLVIPHDYLIKNFIENFKNMYDFFYNNQKINDLFTYNDLIKFEKELIFTISFNFDKKVMFHNNIEDFISKCKSLHNEYCKYIKNLNSHQKIYDIIKIKYNKLYKNINNFNKNDFEKNIKKSFNKLFNHYNLFNIESYENKINKNFLYDIFNKEGIIINSIKDEKIIIFNFENSKIILQNKEGIIIDNNISIILDNSLILLNLVSSSYEILNSNSQIESIKFEEISNDDDNYLYSFDDRLFYILENIFKKKYSNIEDNIISNFISTIITDEIINKNFKLYKIYCTWENILEINTLLQKYEKEIENEKK
jgi:hypothetical protein